MDMDTGYGWPVAELACMASSRINDTSRSWARQACRSHPLRKRIVPVAEPVEAVRNRNKA